MLRNGKTLFSRATLSKVTLNYLQIQTRSTYVQPPEAAMEYYEMLKSNNENISGEIYSNIVISLIAGRGVNSISNLEKVLRDVDNERKVLSSNAYVELIRYCAEMDLTDYAFVTVRKLHNFGYNFSPRLTQEIRSYPALKIKLICHEILPKE